MPGRRCAMYGCDNCSVATKITDPGIVYHNIRKGTDFVTTKIRNEWIRRCRRADEWNPDTSQVCSVHFTETDYERDMRNELLGLPVRKILKKNAVPTLNLPNKPKNTISEREKRFLRKNKLHQEKQRKEEISLLVAGESSSTISQIQEIHQMPGYMCAVAVCKSNSQKAKKSGEKISFHSFPTNKTLEKVWIKRCYRKDKFVTIHKKICSEHFDMDDYEDAIQARLTGVLPKRLKKEAVPHLNLLPQKIPEASKTTEREQRRRKKENKELVRKILDQAQCVIELEPRISLTRIDNQPGTSAESEKLKRSYETAIKENIEANETIEKYQENIAQTNQYFQDATLLAQWSSILKMNLCQNHFICDFHFKVEDIVKSVRHDFPDGNFQIIPRDRWTLLPNSIPVNSKPRKYDDEFSENRESEDHKEVQRFDDQQVLVNSTVKVHKPFQKLDDRPFIKNKPPLLSENVSEWVTKRPKIENADSKHLDLFLQEESIGNPSKQQSGFSRIPQNNEETNMNAEQVSSNTLDSDKSSMTFKDLQSFNTVPPAWYYICHKNEMQFVHVDSLKFTEKLRVFINEDMSAMVSFNQKEKFDLNLKITHPAELSKLFKELKRASICTGTGIKDMSASVRCCGVILNHEKYKRQRQSLRCTACRTLRHRLLNKAAKRRHAANDKCSPQKQLRSFQNKYNRLQKKCRTCLKTSDSKLSFPMDQRLLDKTIKEMILVYVPEMITSSLVKDIICNDCYQVLETFAYFIARCKEVESTLRRTKDQTKGSNNFNNEEINFNSQNVPEEDFLYNNNNKGKQHLQTKTKQGSQALKKGFNTKKLVRTYSTKTNELVTTAEENIKIKSKPVVPSAEVPPESPNATVEDTTKITTVGISQVKTTSINPKLSVDSAPNFYEMKLHDRAITIPQPTEDFPKLLNDFMANGINVLQLNKPSSTSSNARMKRVLLFGSAVIQCPKCHIEFKDWNVLKFHLKHFHSHRLHLANPENEMFDKLITNPSTSTPANICPVCEKNFTTSRMLEQHLGKTHKGYLPYKCEKCGISFRFKSNYQKHLNISNYVQCCTYRKCGYCSEIFNRDVYFDHLKLHKESSCDKCGKSFTTPGRLKLHKMKHGIKHKKNKKARDMQLCPLCGKLFKHTAYLTRHLKTHNESRDKYICDRCAKVYTTKMRLQTHIQRVHMALRKYYECPECKMKLTTASSIRCHMKLKHWNVYSHICHICNEKFVRGDYFRRHMKRHLNIEDCNVLNAGVNRKYSSTKSKSIKCKYCFKLFKDVHVLRLHVLQAHVKTLRFKCRFCSLTFSHRTNKYRHEKRHSDPNFELSCNICWKRMDSKEQLDTHYAKHKKNTKYECEKCGKQLSNRYFLQHHMSEKHTSQEDIERETSTKLKNALEDFLIN